MCGWLQPMLDTDVERLFHQGCVALDKNDLDRAEELLQAALTKEPDAAVINHFAGVVLALKRNHNQAIPCLQKAVEREPENIQFRYNLATTLYQLRLYDEAAEHFERLLERKANHVGALVNLGSIYTTTGYPTRAEKLLKQALGIEPGQVMFWINLGNALQDQGRIDEAMDAYLQAISIEPDNVQANSNLLLVTCYSPRFSEQMRFERHVQWERRIRQNKSTTSSLYVDRRAEQRDKPIRIGYISPDFRRHSVAYFIEPILACHDKSLFEVYCYADVTVADNVTGRLRSHVHKWRNIAGVEDQQVAEQIVSDGIDVLVDLTGHSARNRLKVFLMKPAGVQVTYLGYPATSGLSSMDYRVTDGYADPPDQARFHTEELYRLPSSFLCYHPPSEAPDVAEPPCVQNGYITFGSFNNLPKISDELIAVWADLLNRVPSSRLVLKTKQTRDPEVIRQVRQRFCAHAVDTSRLHFPGHQPSVSDHLACYHSIDIALDTFPYNGTTTTFESLWMGVPVVSLCGSHHAARVGYSIMSNLGLGSLVASSAEEYVARAIFLSSQKQYLEKLRGSLRGAMANSVLCDSQGFTRRLEQAFCQMLQHTKKS